MNALPLAKHKILYTGASGGLGFETTLGFLNKGATVIALDANAEGLDRLKYTAASDALICRQVDLRDSVALEAAISETALISGGITSVINNAAIYPSKPAEDYSAAEFGEVLKVNVEAAFVCMKSSIGFMKQAGWGRIINISSNTVSGGWVNLSPYVASKAALIGLARAWAREFGRLNITANAIAPGAFPTDAELIHPDQDAYQAAIIEGQAIKRRGMTGELAAAIEFLLSDDAAFITGQTLNVDGGKVMH